MYIVKKKVSQEAYEKEMEKESFMGKVLYTITY